MLDFYLRLGPKVVVLKMGEAGAYLATPEHRVRIPSHAVQVVDATGAGDTFCGSFLARILAGDAPEPAARYANVAAALKCTGYGAVAPIPRAGGCVRGAAGNHRPCVNAVSVCRAAVCWAHCPPRWLPPPARRRPTTITGDDALRRLMEGNARYRANQTHTRDFAVGPRRTRRHASTDRLDPELLGCARRAGVRVRPGPGRSVRRAGRRQRAAGRGPGQPGIRRPVPRRTAGVRARTQQLRRGRAAIKVVQGATRASGSPAGADRSDEACRAGGARRSQSGELLHAAIVETCCVGPRSRSFRAAVLAGMIASGR